MHRKSSDSGTYGRPMSSHVCFPLTSKIWKFWRINSEYTSIIRGEFQSTHFEICYYSCRGVLLLSYICLLFSGSHRDGFRLSNASYFAVFANTFMPPTEVKAFVNSIHCSLSLLSVLYREFHYNSW